jgi:tyrosyl-tRNA synthetase
MTMNQEDKIKEVLTRGVENIYPNRQALEKKLKSGQKIRLYCGYDPTAPTLHIGHAITIRKLAQFQALGHEVIFLIGDFTGMIGDPTDKAKARRRLTREQVLKNSEKYKDQAGRILDFSGKNPAKVMYNSQWSDKLSFMDLVNLASNFTAQQTLARDMFKKRIHEGKDLYLHELLYPLMQAYDSVAMDVDLEVGGNDQTFNMLAGRTLMKKIKNKEKFVLTTKLLVDSSGQKMGKTEGKMVSLDTPANEMFGQIMAWSDEIIGLGLELCTDMPMAEVNQIKEQIKQGKINPRDAKARLAREIVAIHHSQKAAAEAGKEFNRIFKEKEKPSQIPAVKLTAKKYHLLDLLVQIKLAPSKSEAKRLIVQGGVKIDNQVVKNWQKEIVVKDGLIIQVGKRKFVKVKIGD